MSKASQQRWRETISKKGGPAPFDPRDRCSEDGELTVERYAVGPDLAAAWLEYRNPLNRPSSKTKVAGYARDMATDAWHENGATIAFNKEGVLCDGEHRLRAIVESGATIWILVAFNSADKGIDRGRMRSVLDERRMRGEKTGRTYIAAVKWLDMLLRDSFHISHTDDDVAKIESEHPLAIEWLKDHAMRGKGMTAGIYAALAIVHEAYPKEADILCEQIHLRESPEQAATNFLRQFRDMSSAGTTNQKKAALLALRMAQAHIGKSAGQYLKASEETLRWWSKKVPEVR